MRIGQFVSSFVGFALMLVLSQALRAQTTTVISIEGESIGGCYSRVEPIAATGEPFTGVLKTKCVQKLADGTAITHEVAAKEARDSRERTYRAVINISSATAEGKAPSVFVAEIKDPANRTAISWNAFFKEATAVHISDPDPAPLVTAHRSTPPPVNHPSMTAPTTAQPNPQFEYLCMKTINEVEVAGTRITKVVPAGREGNDQPLTITSEIWYSAELNATVQQIDTDPRTGVTTTELTEIELGGPDPTLFQPPEGYTVKDQYPNQKN
jgi:hypothetical protein